MPERAFFVAIGIASAIFGDSISVDIRVISDIKAELLLL